MNMTENKKGSERQSIVAAINPQLGDNTTLSSGWVSVAKIKRFLAVFLLGATDIGVTFKIQKATDGSGTGATDAKANTALTATDDNKQTQIDLLTGDLGEGYTHVRIQAVISDGSTGAYVAGILFGLDNRYGMGDENNATSVAEIS